MRGLKIKLKLKSFSAWLENKITKWQLGFLIFILVFALLVIIELAYMGIQWDEITHLNGGSLLLRGEYQEYFASYAFYPPIFDLTTASLFGIIGISVFTARLVSVIFAILSLIIVFKISNKMYGQKTALISTILFGVMPGFVWLSRVAMIETMLVFFFTTSMYFFFNWMSFHKNKDLILSGLMLGVGFLVKYQMIIAGLIMLTSIFMLGRDYLKTKLSRIPLLLLAVALVVIPWIFVSYQIYASGMLDQWIYAIGIGNPEKSLYSVRFPTPIFYFIEMTWPYENVHPISVYLYLIGLGGLGLFSLRRKFEDNFLLIWFGVVFIFFTIIANKHWRYVIPLFPILAISASNLIMFIYSRIQKSLKTSQINRRNKHGIKIVAIIFVLCISVSIFLSCLDSYSWVEKDQIQVQVGEATYYVADRLDYDESLVVLAPFNLFSQDMIKFFLEAKETKNNTVWQYPELPVDT
ncbi:MAG TPA: glycosyltransferase family 39 protein, partial [Candidatus Glassbacteria bacterium]|nr:glycosyltransferase family 39 protein [Candidatus Glassbacteria bacterium]